MEAELEKITRKHFTENLRNKYYNQHKIQLSIYPQRELYLTLVDAYEDYCWNSLKKKVSPKNFSAWLIDVASAGLADVVAGEEVA